MTMVQLPGLVDLQVNGFAGWDVNSPDVDAAAIVELTRALWAVGTTTYLPTVITAPEERMMRSLRAVSEARSRNPVVAHSIAGIHVEGPFLSGDPGARGAHEADQLRDADLAEFDRWQDAAAGLIRIVTIAPEVPGAVEFVAGVVQRGVRVSIGHTAATPDQIRSAVDAGASLSTHLGNGAPRTLPRHPNLLWTQLAEERLAAMLITDGHHLSREVATVMLRAKGMSNVILTSDAASLAGALPGVYDTAVGGRVVVELDGRLVLEGSDLLAGSGASLMECLEWSIGQLPFDEDDLVALATRNPARMLGLGERVGPEGDRIVLERTPGRGIDVREVVVAGERVVG